jgi:hypothetical protein
MGRPLRAHRLPGLRYILCVLHADANAHPVRDAEPNPDRYGYPHGDSDADGIPDQHGDADPD